MKSETTLSRQDGEITSEQLHALRQRAAHGLRRAAWKILLGVAVICGSALILSSSIFADLGDAATTLTWVAVALTVPGTGAAAYFFYKAKKISLTNF